MPPWSGTAVYGYLSLPSPSPPVGGTKRNRRENTTIRHLQRMGRPGPRLERLGYEGLESLQGLTTLTQPGRSRSVYSIRVHNNRSSTSMPC